MITMIFRPQAIVATVDAALLLFVRLTAKLTKDNEHNFEVLMMSLTIVLLSLSKFEQNSHANKDTNKVMEVLEMAAHAFMEWIVHKDVIGGSQFGGKAADYLCELQVCMYHRSKCVYCILWNKVG